MTWVTVDAADAPVPADDVAADRAVREVSREPGYVARPQGHAGYSPRRRRTRSKTSRRSCRACHSWRSSSRARRRARLLTGEAACARVIKFAGEVRAVGYVKQDQVYLMARVGIDAFDLSPDQKPEEAIATLDRFKIAYTPGAPLPGLQRERFHV